jgi:hypothetical protein
MSNSRLSISLSARIALDALGKDNISAVNRFSTERLSPTSDIILIYPGVNRISILAKSFARESILFQRRYANEPPTPFILTIDSLAPEDTPTIKIIKSRLA